MVLLCFYFSSPLHNKYRKQRNKYELQKIRNDNKNSHTVITIIVLSKIQ